jgi:acylglycerol lipase
VPLFVHGHSMGGLVAAHLAAGEAGRRQPLAGVVLSSAALKLPAAAAGAAQHVVGAIATVAPGKGLEAVDPATLVRDEAARQALAADPLLSREKVPAATVATILRGIVALPQRADAFAAPLLVLHGTADRVTEPAGSRELAARTPGSTLKLYDGRLHDLLHDAGGDEVVREVVAFVAPKLKEAPKP